MERIREAARFNYEQQSSSKKEKILKKFHKINKSENSDGGRLSRLKEKLHLGRVRELLKLAKSHGSRLSEERINVIVAEMKKHETDSSSTRSFEDFITFEYLCENWPICDACKAMIHGMYYACVSCWKKYLEGEESSYELCYQCFTSKSFEHKHNKFVDNQVLLRSWTKMREKKRAEEEDAELVLDLLGAIFG